MAPAVTQADSKLSFEEFSLADRRAEQLAPVRRAVRQLLAEKPASEIPDAVSTVLEDHRASLGSQYPSAVAAVLEEVYAVKSYSHLESAGALFCRVSDELNYSDVIRLGSTIAASLSIMGLDGADDVLGALCKRCPDVAGLILARIIVGDIIPDEWKGSAARGFAISHRVVDGLRGEIPQLWEDTAREFLLRSGEAPGTPIASISRTELFSRFIDRVLEIERLQLSKFDVLMPPEKRLDLVAYFAHFARGEAAQRMESWGPQLAKGIVEMLHQSQTQSSSLSPQPIFWFERGCMRLMQLEPEVRTEVAEQVARSLLDHSERCNLFPLYLMRVGGTRALPIAKVNELLPVAFEILGRPRREAAYLDLAELVISRDGPHWRAARECGMKYLKDFLKEKVLVAEVDGERGLNPYVDFAESADIKGGQRMDILRCIAESVARAGKPALTRAFEHRVKAKFQTDHTPPRNIWAAVKVEQIISVARGASR